MKCPSAHVITLCRPPCAAFYFFRKLFSMLLVGKGQPGRSKRQCYQLQVPCSKSLFKNISALAKLIELKRKITKLVFMLLWACPVSWSYHSPAVGSSGRRLPNAVESLASAWMSVSSSPGHRGQRSTGWGWALVGVSKQNERNRKPIWTISKWTLHLFWVFFTCACWSDTILTCLEAGLFAHDHFIVIDRLGVLTHLDKNSRNILHDFHSVGKASREALSRQHGGIHMHTWMCAVRVLF